MSGLEVGARCIRGPDWSWGDQDGGPGHVGTVVQLGRSGQPGCLPGTVMVHWDNGVIQNYRAGYNNGYDLRLLDPAPCGVFHGAVRCDGCQRTAIFGFRWICKQCPDLDLCSRCYNLKYHDVNHEFVRRQEPGGPGVRVPPRATSNQLEIFGVFRGAMVVRGRDWDWGDQDGGLGSQGWVKEITNWNDQTGSSVACVIWSGHKENLYRLGHKGKVDVRCVTPASGGKVYSSHLPVFGKPIDTGRTFLIGQTVEVCVDLETLKRMQMGHGEFREEMRSVIGRRGKVHRLTEKSDVRVQFPGTPPPDHRWTINPLALKLIRGYNVGDKVTITSDKALIAKYHQNHAALDGFSACTGTVSLVHSESSIVVDFGGGRVGALHPGIIVPPRHQDECHNVNTALLRAAVAGDAVEVEKILTGSRGSNFGILPDNEAILTGLHKAALKGFTEVVSSIIKFRPVLINQKLQDKTVLMVAAYEGNVGLINWLLGSGGDGGIADSSGDLPLHYAAIGAKPLAILTLVDKGSAVNAQNVEKRTALHLAVINRDLETVRALLKVGASVNIQDRNYETPLHISINSGSDDISDLLTGHADLLLCDQNGWNPLHLAVRAGNVNQVGRLVEEDRRIVNIVTRDGLAPLHIAARGNLSVVQHLLNIPECDINIQDGGGRTVLHHAALTSQLPLIQLLTRHRLEVNHQDLEGNTAAHLAISAPPVNLENPYTNELEDVFEAADLASLATFNLNPGQTLQVGVLVVLLGSVDRDLRNQDGDTPEDLVENPDLRRFIQDYLNRPQLPSLNRPQPAGAEHDYAEIVDEVSGRRTVLGLPRDEGAGGLPPRLGLSAGTGGVDCRVCSEPNSLVVFHPCRHQIACQDCAVRMKRCLECQLPIDRKSFDAEHTDPKEVGRLKSLEQKVQDLEEQFLCGICLERKRNVAFLCGHGACAHCTQDLVNCHMCRTKIERKIPLY